MQSAKSRWALPVPWRCKSERCFALWLGCLVSCSVWCYFGFYPTVVGTFLTLWCGSPSLGCLISTLTSLDLRCLSPNELPPLCFCQNSKGSRRLCVLCGLTADSFEVQPWIVEQNSMLQNILSHWLTLELAGIITFIHLKLPDRTANRHWCFGDPRENFEGLNVFPDMWHEVFAN